MSKDATEILFVEDSEPEIELTLRALQDQSPGIRIHVARDGEEALQYLAACEAAASSGGGGRMPKVMLLDLKLPKVDGHEVLRQTRDNPATKMVPVVALTSSNRREDMVEAYLAGVNSYVQKPVKFDDFRKIVKDLSSYWLGVNQVPSPAFDS